MIGQDPERQAPSGDLPDPATGDGRDSVTAMVIGATDVTELTLRARGFARARESIGCITGPAADTSASEDPPVVLVQADSGSAASMQQVLAISDSFGIIIDGGAGGPLAVIEAFAQYWTHLAGDGTYVIDQLDCANPASAKDTALQTLSIVGFVKRLWDVAHLNQCSGAASRAALLAPFSETIGIEFREDELRRILDVELSATRCVIHKAPATAAHSVRIPSQDSVPGAAGNACGEQAAEGRADADARWAVLDRNREVFALEQEIRTLRARCEALAAVESEFTALGESRSWRWTRPLRVLLGLLLREPAYVGQLRSLTRWIHSRGLGGWLHALFPPDSPIEQMGVPRPRRRRDVSVDIVVLIDGQVALVRQCLDAVLRSTLPPYRLFLMDVSGKPEIDAYLDRLAATHGAQLLPHDPSLGVGRTLYAALQPEKGWLALLRDDTIVSEGWLDALMQAAAIYPRAAVVGPLTTAMLHEWLPATEQGAIIGETTTGLADLDDIAAAVLRVGCRQPIAVRHLDGACLLVRRELLNASTGVDARTLAKGIELNPTPWSWTRRWRPRLLLADDVYVETRAKPTGRCRQSEQNAVGVDANRGDTNAGRGSANIESDTCHLIALAATCGRLAEEIQWGRAALSRNPRLEGRRVAFLMPAGTVSAGIAALLDQAQALRDLGVDAWIVRVGLVRPPSEAVSPAFQLPVLWARSARDVQTTLADVDIRFDAVVAVGMDMLGALPLAAGPICGCYLPADSRIEPAVLGSEQRALLRRPTSGRLRLLAQIGGTAESLAKQLAVQSGVVGASIDTAVFRPSPAMDVGNRAPRISVLLGRDLEGAGLSLWELPVRLRSRLRLPMPVDAVLAADLSLALKDPAATESLADLSPQDLSIRLRRSDIFLDLSDSPAGEFVTLAAMACGCAVIISCTGTGPEFARHEGNALIVANADQDAPIAAVARLAADHVLCDRLRRQAALDAAARPHRRAALALAITLFDGDLEARRH